MEEIKINYQIAVEKGTEEAKEKFTGLRAEIQTGNLLLGYEADFESALSSFAEKIKEGVESDKNKNILSWHKLPIKKPLEGQLGLIMCDCCGGSLFSVRSKFPGEERRIICPTCAIEILEDIYSNLNTETSQQKNEMPNL